MLNLHTCFAPTCFPEKREDLGLNDDEQIELTVAFYSVAVGTLFIRLVLNYELPGTLKLVDLAAADEDWQDSCTSNKPH